LTSDLAEARGFQVDRAGFEEAMEAHRKTSGTGSFSGNVFAIGPIHEIKNSTAPTEFFGYAATEGNARVSAVIVGDEVARGSVAAGHSDPITLVLDRTPFYGESGGQIGDVGSLTAGSVRFEVVDTQKTDGYVQHVGFVRSGSVQAGLAVHASVDAARRQGIERAHSATHILHWALHQVLGHHATQAGSKVEDDVLRFDFSHAKGMTNEEIAEVERLTNEQIMSAQPIRWEVKPIEQARQEGATALFGEKYGDEVRVVTMGGFSKEFCGGCHLANTGMAGPVKILREESVSAGTRRLTALTGHAALRWMREQAGLIAEVSGLLKARPEEIGSRIASLQREVKELQRTVEKEKARQTAGQAVDLLAQAREIGGARVLVLAMSGSDGKQLQAQVDQLMSKGAGLAVLLLGESDGKLDIVSAVSRDLVDRGMDASAWLRLAAEKVDGKGGGKPHLARGGGTVPAKAGEAVEAALGYAQKVLAS
jgi:alanyl-tRNA synthetase